MHHLDHLGAIWCVSNSDLSFLDISLYAWGILLSFLIVGSHLWCGFQAETWVSLVVLQGFEVHIGIVERLGRMKLDLEAVVEDACDEVLQFEIQRSLINLKFVQYNNISYHTISTSTFYQNPSRGGIILRNLIMLNHVWVPAVKLSFTSSKVVTHSSIRGDCLHLVARLVP